MNIYARRHDKIFGGCEKFRGVHQIDMESNSPTGGVAFGDPKEHPPVYYLYADEIGARAC